MTDSLAMRLRDVEVRFQQRRSLFHGARGGFPALRGISMELRHGEKLGIIGRNGAGKSTLLRVLAGVLEPDAGTIERNHGACRLLALGTGFMPNLSGRENAVLSGLMLGMQRREVVPKLEAIKEFSELGDFFEQPVRTYSSGMKSRLGFSVAIQQQPDILLIDETLAVGDAQFKQKSLAALRGRLGDDSTLVLVSHSNNLIADVCDRAVLLDEGQVVEAGAIQTTFKAYEARVGHKQATAAGET